LAFGDEFSVKSALPLPNVTAQSNQVGIRALMLEAPPLYLVTGAIVAGDALGNLRVFVPLSLALGLALVASTLFLLGRPAWGLAVALLGIVCAATRPIDRLLEPEFSSRSVGTFPDGVMITLQGRVIRAPERQEGERTYLYIDVDNGGPAGAVITPMTGLVRVTAIGEQAFRIGDEVRVSGKIRFPRNDGDEGEFDYQAWLMRQGIVATMVAVPTTSGSTPSIALVGHHAVFGYSRQQAIRDRLSQFIDVTLRYPENAEMRALIIGDRGGIDEHVRQPFALTGMAHLLVISGLHLGFVAAAAFLLARFVMAAFPAIMAVGYANKIAAVAAATAVSAYAAIAGGYVSTVRALVMVLAYALALLIDRSRELLASLALAALVICFAIPGSTADIGFQLSFASVAAILLGMRRFSAWWRWHFANPLSVRREPSRSSRAAEWICGYVAVSFWAMLGAAPLTAFHFNQFSLVGLIANAVVVPIMGFGSVVCGLIAAASSFIYVPLASRILQAAAQLATAGTFLARCFASWPMAWVRCFTPTSVELAIVYCFILLWLTAPLAGAEVLHAMRRQSFEPQRPTSNRSGPDNDDSSLVARWRASVTALLVVAVAIDAGWSTYQRFFNPNLRVTFLSVGEGDAAVVRFPGGRVMLIDGGGGFSGAFDPGERIVAPYLWSHKIMHVDYVALSHPDRDHFGGLIYIVRNFKPAQFWTAGAQSEDTSYDELLDAVKLSGARQRLCDSASPSMSIAGVTMRCVGPIHGVPELKRNNSSMILRIAYGRESFLFSGDVEEKGEHELVASAAELHATVLKVPHHGSRTSSSAAFIEAVHPEIAVISLGYLNHFNFPAPEIVQRYKDADIELLRTDSDGEVSVDASRNALTVATFRHGMLRLYR
jgi:competence protein ComEC